MDKPEYFYTCKRLNWKQACKLLNCGKSHFYRLVKSGTLPAWRIDGSRRGLFVLEKDVLELLKQACEWDS